MGRQIAIITGEASGDRVGGQLAQEILRLRPDWELIGTGGKHLREAGVEVLVDSSRWGVVGVAQGLALLPTILAARHGLLRELTKRKPDLVIAVDAGAFHLGFPGVQGLCPWIREHLPQTRILYYFPPGSWRRTIKRTTLATNADIVATPFPWSETELQRHGVNAHFVGHPLLDLAQPTLSSEEFSSKYGIETEQPVVGILPGSRRAEIENILPAQLAAAEIIRRRVPGVQFVLALASTVDRDAIVKQIDHYQKLQEQQLRNEELFQQKLRERASEREDATNLGGVRVPVGADGPPTASPEDLASRQKSWIAKAAEMPEAPTGPLPLVVVEDAAYDVMAASDVLMIASGTATLEATVLGKPMVILYKMSPWNKPQYYMVRRSLPPFIGLPNLIANKRIVPEFIQDAATPDALATAVIDFLLEPERMLKAREELVAIRELLGTPGGAARTAQMAVDLVETGTDGNASVSGLVD